MDSLCDWEGGAPCVVPVEQQVCVHTPHPSTQLQVPVEEQQVFGSALKQEQELYY